MSLSFISKTIQTTKENGDFEEKPVENPTVTGASRVSGGSSGLFEQLRKNKEQEEDEREEFQRSIMRGTLTLDEDDAAHLDFLSKQKEKERSAMRNATELAVADFRLAQSERMAKPNTTKFGDSFQPERKPSVALPGPSIVLKKRKRVEEKSESSGSTGSDSARNPQHLHTSSKKSSAMEAGVINNLLSGYSSSSSDE